MDFKTALKIVEDHAEHMLDAQGSNIEVLGVANKDQQPLSQAKDFCVTAIVQEKLTTDQLGAQNLQEFADIFAMAVGGGRPQDFEIDVVESGGPFQLQNSFTVPAAQRGLYGGNPPALNAQKDFATLRCGIGVTNPTSAYPNNLSVGTAGFYVKDDNDEFYLVSNNHVIGRVNNAQPGEAVVQPGTLDLTRSELTSMPNLQALTAQLQVAEISGVVPIAFRSSSNIPVNLVDAAYAKLTGQRPPDDIDRLTFGGGIQSVAPPYQQDADGNITGSTRVFKVGRTTGYTEGEVWMLAAQRNVDYDGQVARFGGQIVIRPTPDNVGPFSDRGDSGSGVLNDRNQLVGLLFAGSPRFTIVNPIADVLTALSNVAGKNLSVVTV